jgi:hypothetical protein
MMLMMIALWYERPQVDVDSGRRANRLIRWLLAVLKSELQRQGRQGRQRRAIGKGSVNDNEGRYGLSVALAFVITTTDGLTESITPAAVAQRSPKTNNAERKLLPFFLTWQKPSFSAPGRRLPTLACRCPH